MLIRASPILVSVFVCASVITSTQVFGSQTATLERFVGFGVIV